MITREQCYAAYLALPTKGRTVKALYIKLVADGVDPPAVSTLTNWCAEGKWRQRVQDAEAGVVARVDEIIEQKAETRVKLYEIAEESALAGFASLQRELPNVKIRNAKDAKIMAELTVSLAEAATVMRERGLMPAMPLLEGPYAALAGNGNDPIAKALEGLFLEPPDSA
jgi:hypothetical protein